VTNTQFNDEMQEIEVKIENSFAKLEFFYLIEYTSNYTEE